MDDTKFAQLAATVEVLGTAVRIMIADRIMDAAPDVREEFLTELQRQLSTASKAVRDLDEATAVAFADLAVWQPIAAERLTDGVRALVDRELESSHEGSPERS